MGAGEDPADEAAPDDPSALRRQGITAYRAGRFAEALEPLGRAAALDPADWVSRVHIGMALRALGRPAEAVAAYDAAAAVQAENADLYNNRGNALVELRRFEAALADFDRALALQPGFVPALASRGLALTELGQPEAALAALDAAVGLAPQDGRAQMLRGNALMALARPQDALAAYDLALGLDPGDATAHYGRARALAALDAVGGLPAALESYAAALRLKPDFADVRWSRALALLRVGRFAEGWADYEHRWDATGFLHFSGGQVTPALAARLTPPASAADLAGRSVLLLAEQGVGDVVMFASILPDLLATAAAVTLVCETRLRRLFANSFPGLQVLEPAAAEAAAAGFDAVLALGSLGRLFRPRREDFRGAPYLSASDAVRARWTRRLAGLGDGLRVGLSWRGGSSRTGSADRSVRLATLAPLLDLPGCAFVNLQYGDTREEVAGTPLWSPDPAEVADFEDLAGLVQALDLVVSVQTTVVHLAGALGAPCLAMLPRQAEWRYGAGAETMAWYRSVRLVRQGPDGGWGPVVARVVDDVRRAARSPGPG